MVFTCMLDEGEEHYWHHIKIRLREKIKKEGPEGLWVINSKYKSLSSNKNIKLNMDFVFMLYDNGLQYNKLFKTIFTLQHWIIKRYISLKLYYYAVL